MGMTDYTNHTEVLNLLASDQDADKDRREKAREAEGFLHDPDGQWEQDIITRFKGRPRYTFDLCNPIVDQIATEVENQDYAVDATHTDAEGSEEQAEIKAGMIRAIQTWSKASDLVYKPASRVTIEAGFAAAEVTQEWADADVFEQDLFVRTIPNAIDRVWVDQGSVAPDWSDGNHEHVMQTLTKMEYDDKFPDGSGKSVSQDRTHDRHFQKPDLIVVGRILYRKPIKKELVQMTDGRVLEVNDDFEKIKDELADVGILEQRRRTRDTFQVISRLYDGGGWLTPEQETVFSLLPVVPMYGYHRVMDNKVMWRGIVEKLMDSQRVFNYAESRNVEDTALAPKDKIMGTKEQIAGNPGWSSLNTNSDPALIYTHVPGQPPPFKIGGPQPNAGLLTVSESMRRNVTQSSSMFASNMGDNPGLQSGIAIERLQDAGNSGADKFIDARRIFGNRIYEVMMDAIPRVYDTKRTAFILGEDGKGRLEALNDTVIDDESGQPVVVNDLSKGRYQVTCKAGKSFTSRQQEGAAATMELAQVMPGLMETGSDVVISALGFPGSETLAERERLRLMQTGQIPQSQMTEDELEQLQAQQEAAQNQPPSPQEQLVAIEAQRQQAEAQDKEDKNQIAAQKVVNERLKIVQGGQNDQANTQIKAADQASQQQLDMANLLNIMADTMNKIREAQGIDTFTGPHAQEAFIQQAGAIDAEQQRQGQEPAESLTSEVSALANRDIGQ
jgi:hypothetical protein